MKCSKCKNFDLDDYECSQNKAPLQNKRGVFFCNNFKRAIKKDSGRASTYHIFAPLSDRAITG